MFPPARQVVIGSTIMVERRTDNGQMSDAYMRLQASLIKFEWDLYCPWGSGNVTHHSDKIVDT